MLFSAHRPAKKAFASTPASIQLRRLDTSSCDVSPTLMNVRSTWFGGVSVEPLLIFLA